MWNARTDALFEDIEQEIHRQRAQALARRAYAERVIKETGHLPIATEAKEIILLTHRVDR